MGILRGNLPQRVNLPQEQGRSRPDEIDVLSKPSVVIVVIVVLQSERFQIVTGMQSRSHASGA